MSKHKYTQYTTLKLLDVFSAFIHVNIDVNIKVI